MANKPKPRIKGYQDGGTIDPGPSASDRMMSAVRNGATLARIGQLYGLGGAASGTSGAAGAAGGNLPMARKGGTIKRVAGKPFGKEDGLIGAQKGEYVVRKAAVKKLGMPALNQINKGKIPARAKR